LEARVLVKFLPSGDAFGFGGRFNTCFLVERGNVSFRKVRFHLDYATLCDKLPLIAANWVILTHMSSEMLAKGTSIGDCEMASEGHVVVL
jgi:hypothetical protein